MLDKTSFLILMSCKSDSHSCPGEGFPEHVQQRRDLRTNRHSRQAVGSTVCQVSVLRPERTTAFSKLREQNGAAGGETKAGGELARSRVKSGRHGLLA